jgi:hypothetical protein
VVLRSDDGNWVWAFVLLGAAPGTRLISRNRIRRPGASGATRAFTRYVMEPGSLMMERKMLRGLRARAEGRPGVGTPDVQGPAPSMATGRHQAAASSGAPAASS